MGPTLSKVSRCPPDPQYPPPPWRLRGEAAILTAPVRAQAARAAGVPGGATLRSAGGWTLGGVLLARYDETATLAYHELIVFSGLATVGGRPAFIVSHIYVDSPASRLGGREIWGLPKELAGFAWSSREARVEQDGRLLLRARLRRRAGGVPLPMLAASLGRRDGLALRASGAGVLRRAVPALGRLEVPDDAPFAFLGLAGTRAGVAGDGLDLRFGAPA
jgi:hypothetical protein